jgi:hypothetical protein
MNLALSPGDSAHAMGLYSGRLPIRGHFVIGLHLWLARNGGGPVTRPDDLRNVAGGEDPQYPLHLMRAKDGYGICMTSEPHFNCNMACE